MLHHVHLGQIIVDAKPGFACGQEDPDGVVQVRMHNVSSEGRLSFNVLRRVPRSFPKLDRFYLRRGDVLFNATNSPELVGKTAVFSEYPEPLVYSNHFLRLRVDDRVADSSYLARWIQFLWSQGEFQRICRRWVNQAAVGSDRLLATKVPLPPLAEQKRIAAILDAAEALRGKRRQSIAKLDSLVQSVFLEIFRNLKRSDWDFAPIAELAAPIQNAIRTGPFGSQLLHSEFVDSGVAVLGIDNAVENRFVWARPRFITDRKYELLRRYTIFPGDVLITIMGTCGRCAVVPDNVPKAINTEHLCCITLDRQRCLPDYFHACFLNHPEVARQLGVRKRGAVMPGLNMQLIKELRLPVPSIHVQKKLVDFLATLNRQITRFEKSLAQIDCLLMSLQQRAFRAEL
jgi:type I restriction enzyme, S subunit